MMFFDDIVDKHPDLHITSKCKGNIRYLRDAILFKIDKSVFDDAYIYWADRQKKEPKKFTWASDYEIDYARVPYDNIFIYFGGSKGYWIIGEHFDNIYGVAVFAFDKTADQLAREVPAKKENIPEGAAPELFSLNLWPRLIGINIDTEKRIAGIPVLMGCELGDSNDLDEKLFKDLPVLHSYFTIALIILRILTLLNCKNIRQTKITPFPLDSKIQKARWRKNKFPLASYYTLDVHFNNSTSSKHKNSGTHECRLHLCRGHFKYYTKDNPLFGKLTGLWWWQPSIRGQKEKGIIVKDYKLAV